MWCVYCRESVSSVHTVWCTRSLPCGLYGVNGVHSLYTEYVVCILCGVNGIHTVWSVYCMELVVRLLYEVNGPCTVWG